MKQCNGFQRIEKLLQKRPIRKSYSITFKKHQQNQDIN
ncbi:hypothetical protein BARBAKC583_0759 [Bartonella bacilliformis KC583]|uniref:Uncharacterized protein n=1 Tax=Bartonella bacilliformis (strain ATCC 35685 / KC583 / Herrer 020/F12,63) TaxID=360095 RepID=A1USV3_BARBK|nr:hypothetical protein BARBAKC583_0759 [Bartonella bacilliformis KC583]